MNTKGLAAISIYAVALFAATHVYPACASDSSCPDGGYWFGAAPPDGTERGCQKEDNDRNLVKHGPWTEWYMNGAIHIKGEYLKGRRTGLWTWWYPNGLKMQEGRFWEGNAVGNWTFWDQNGNKQDKNSHPNLAKKETTTEKPGAPKPLFEDFSQNLKKGF